MDVKEYVINQLTIEGYQLLSEIAKEHVGANGGAMSWFQNVIARAEEADNTSRLLAATVVMKAYAEESMSQSSDPDSLTRRVEQGIKSMVER